MHDDNFGAVQGKNLTVGAAFASRCYARLIESRAKHLSPELLLQGGGSVDVIVVMVGAQNMGQLAWLSRQELRHNIRITWINNNTAAVRPLQHKNKIVFKSVENVDLHERDEEC